MFSIRFDVSEVQDRLERVLDYARGPALKTAGDVVMVDMTEKTAQGVDADGRPFEPYAESTIKQRRRQGLQTTYVDLFESGRMRTGDRFEVDQLIPTGTHAFLAGIHNAGLGNVPERKYFAVGHSSIPKIEDKLTQGVNGL